MGRNRNRNRQQKALPNTTQIKQVQGPQKPPYTPSGARQHPDQGLVQLDATLTEKYLGRGLLGLGPFLEVLSNASGDDLLRQHGYALYRRMMMDPEVDASLDTLVQSSSSQPIKVVAAVGPNDPRFEEAEKYAKFGNYVLDRFDADSWRKEQTRAALSMGNAAAEIDWNYLETGPYAGRLVIDNVRTIPHEDYGYIVDRWGEIYGVAPMGNAAAGMFPLGNIIPLSSTDLAKRLNGAVPRYKLTVWTWEKRGNDPRGTSVLGPAYIPWWSKQRAIEEWSCWIGRFAQPSIWATPGPDALPTCDPVTGNPINPTELLLQALMSFKSASVLALPHGSQVNLLQAQNGAREFIDSIRAWNTEITRSILGQHLATAEGENQSRAAADVHSLVLRQLINSIRRWVARNIRKDLIKPLIEGNFGDVGDLMPDIDLGDGDGWLPTVTEIAVLMQAGYFTEDQLPKLDKILGVPVRETNIPTGPAAVAAKVEIAKEKELGNQSANDSGGKDTAREAEKSSPDS